MSEAPKRFQQKRTKGWRKPPNSKCVTRGSRWGNEFDVKVYGHDGAIAKYEEWLAAKSPAELAAYLEPLLGFEALGCYCEPHERCHVDVLLRLLRQMEKRRVRP